MSTEVNLNKMLSVTIKTVECCQKPETVKILSNKTTSRAQRSTRVRSNELRTALIMQRQQEDLTEIEFASHRAKSQCLQNHLVAKAQEEFYL
jgi:hypothetical protein